MSHFLNVFVALISGLLLCIQQLKKILLLWVPAIVTQMIGLLSRRLEVRPLSGLCKIPPIAFCPKRIVHFCVLLFYMATASKSKYVEWHMCHDTILATKAIYLDASNAKVAKPCCQRCYERAIIYAYNPGRSTKFTPLRAF
jgi:hypothetical protein